MDNIKEVIRVLGFIQEYFDNHADEQEPNKRKELFVDWSDTVLEAITLLKAQEPVEPVRRRRHGQIGYSCFCGMCGYGIGRNEKYCALCGRAVKWE